MFQLKHPLQDLTPDDSPWNGGGGGNKTPLTRIQKLEMEVDMLKETVKNLLTVLSGKTDNNDHHN